MARPRHGYKNAHGDPVPGVTTVIGILDKPALIGWAGKLCAQAGFTAALEGAAEPPYWRDVCYGIRDRAAEDGTTAHALFEQFLNGNSPERGEYTDGAWQAYQNARKWHGNLALEFQVWPYERPLITDTFAGTPDALAKEPGGAIWLADWKTGGVYPDQLIQMGAYAYLLREVEGIEVEGAHLVRFHREHGDFHHHQWARDVVDLGWEVFRHLLMVYEPLRKLRARCK